MDHFALRTYNFCQFNSESRRRKFNTWELLKYYVSRNGAKVYTINWETKKKCAIELNLNFQQDDEKDENDNDFFFECQESEKFFNTWKFPVLFLLALCDITKSCFSCEVGQSQGMNENVNFSFSLCSKETS